MANDLFSTPEHTLFRETVRKFVDEELRPRAREFDAAGRFDKNLYKKMGDLGMLGLRYDPRWGGAGLDYSYMAILFEEIGRCDNAGVAMGISVHTDMATPSLHQFGSDELKQEFLVPAIAGECVSAIAVTEPGAGSDVAAISTRAVRSGDEWMINGSKIYITNAATADWLCLLAVTDPDAGYGGFSQIIVPTDTPGFRYDLLDKIGNWGSDTGQLYFENVRVPIAYTIGEIGRGFQQQMTQFQNERMIAAYMAVGGMERALSLTAAYLRDRQTFGAPLLSRQYVQFRLAELAADLDVLKHYNYACAEAFLAGRDTTRFATIAKLKAGRLHREIADTCLQFHGGFGYMEESWTSRYFRDSRLMSIGGGSDEVMLQILARLDGFTQ
jgi:citronellyl-CoA dehydrogenase